MEKCNACGKKSFMPEKINNINICKVCFLKIGGPLWKRQYDKAEDLEKNRNNALAAAHKEHFSADVVFAINSFFREQQSHMQVCSCCGVEVQNLEKLGQKQICKKCYKKLDVASWIEGEYDDNIDVEESRKRVLKIAQKNQYHVDIVKEINALFDAKIEKDLLYCIDGGVGQKLKVYTGHCVLITSEWCDVEELSARYKRVQKQFNIADGMQVIGTAASLLSPMISGNSLVRKGVQAIGKSLESASKNTPSEEVQLNIIKGKFRIDYGVYTSTDYKKCGDGENDVGFIRFYKRNCGVRDARVFLFANNSNRVEKGYKTICEGMDEFEYKKETSFQNQQPQLIQQVSAADEILKFKQLLDANIITQEEFEQKKKELLGLS